MSSVTDTGAEKPSSTRRELRAAWRALAQIDDAMREIKAPGGSFAEALCDIREILDEVYANPFDSDDPAREKTPTVQTLGEAVAACADYGIDEINPDIWPFQVARALRRAEQVGAEVQSELASLRAERAEFVERLLATLEERPLPDGTYSHLVYCNGPRTVPPGTRGVTCNCRVGAVRAKQAEDELIAAREEISILKQRISSYEQLEQAEKGMVVMRADPATGFISSSVPLAIDAGRKTRGLVRQACQAALSALKEMSGE